MKLLWCPRCHRRIVPPDVLKNGNLKVQGAIVLKCPCGGQVTIRQGA